MTRNANGLDVIGSAVLHGNVNYSKTCETDCTCTSWLSCRCVVEEGATTSFLPRRCTIHRLINRLGVASVPSSEDITRAHWLFSMTGGSLVIAEGREAREYNFKRDVASRKSSNFPKWISLSALVHKRTSSMAITIVNSNVIRPLIM